MAVGGAGFFHTLGEVFLPSFDDFGVFNAFFAFELGFEEAQEGVNLPLAMPTLSLIQASNSASESPRNDSERMILGSAAELTGSLGWGFDAV